MRFFFNSVAGTDDTQLAKDPDIQSNYGMISYFAIDMFLFWRPCWLCAYRNVVAVWLHFNTTVFHYCGTATATKHGRNHLSMTFCLFLDCECGFADCQHQPKKITLGTLDD